MSHANENEPIAAIREQVERLMHLERLAEEARADLRQATQNLALIADKNMRLRAVRTAYWSMPAVRADDLAIALFGSGRNKFTYKMRQLVGPCGYTQCHYKGCENQAPIRSRAAREREDQHYCRDHLYNQRPPISPEKEAELNEYFRKQNEIHARNMAELDTFADQADLSEAQLIRLYELIAEKLDWRDRV